MVQTGNQIDVANGYSTESCDELGYGLADHCPHVQKSCEPNKLRKALKTAGLLTECPQCVREAGEQPDATAEGNELEPVYEYEESLWVCLQCGAQLCGRTKNQHALAHNQKPHSDEHNLALNSTYFAVWCYKCDLAVSPTSTKKLQACVDMVKRECTKNKSQPSEEDKNLLNTSLSSVEPSVTTTEMGTIVTSSSNSGSASFVSVAPVVDLESLPRVRGLTNLGNTCFFNAVLQCLSQTPFLLEVLKESSEPGEKFSLPGGRLKMDNNEEIFLKAINGVLNSWGPLTKVLAETLEALQLGTGGVYNPSSLLRNLSQKWPQFGNGDQQDSHELLRHLLESVRCEDLRRYQSIILKLLGYSSKVDPANVEEAMKSKIKYYGVQVSERILRPEQVFRGFLVSTLTCQDCSNTSSRHEFFLDLSLPIQMEKPHPPMRRKSSPEPTESKFKSKKEKERERRAKRAAKKQAAKGGEKGVEVGSSSNETDGDVEDNVEEPKSVKKSSDDNGNAVKEEKDPIRNEVVEVGISSAKVNSLIKLTDQMDELNLEEARTTRRKRCESHADWSNTLAPRYQCEDGECSVQSCLNNFTSIELMTGNNKVTCDACTERFNGKNGKPVHTNATKQLLISSPPAVLILHLKRFQVGPRCLFRKLTKHVTFPLVLDIAPFCASKVKRLPNVRPNQKQLPYSLYGVVEHSGTMHGGHYVAYVKVRQKLEEDDPRWSFLPKGSKAELDQIDEQKARLESNSFESDESSELSSASMSGSSSDASSDVEGATGTTYTTPPQPSLPDPLPGKWYYVSDSRVQAVSEKEVLNTQAYLLFYERIETDTIEED